MMSMIVFAVSLGPESVVRRSVYCSTVLARNTASMGSCRFFPSLVKFLKDRALSTRLVLLAKTLFKAKCSNIFVVSETNGHLAVLRASHWPSSEQVCSATRHLGERRADAVLSGVRWCFPELMEMVVVVVVLEVNLCAPRWWGGTRPAQASSTRTPATVLGHT